MDMNGCITAHALIQCAHSGSLSSFFLSFINSPRKDDGDNFLNKLGKKIKIKELNAG